MHANGQFDLLVDLPGAEFQRKIAAYQVELLPFVSRMKELVDAGNPVASHQAFKDYTTYCRWPIRQMEYSFFIRNLPSAPTGLALEAGSGVTPFPYLLTQKGWETISTDIEADQMELLAAYGKEAYGFATQHKVDDLRFMQFPDHHFSLITCVSVLEHLQHHDLPTALAEMVRVAKPGARIIITTDVYPIDHPAIPQNHGAFTAAKIGLLFTPFATACGVFEAFVPLLNKIKQLTMANLEQFWTEHWQPGFWEGKNRGYCAIAMVFDLPNDAHVHAALIKELKSVSKHPLFKNPDLYQQQTDFEVIETLLPFLENKTFLDIGAELGTFTEFLSSKHMRGTFFEPLPKFADHLQQLAQKTQCHFLSYAIDQTDRQADFYMACDEQNQSMDYFSSLHPLADDKRIQHKKVATVTCRSLNSLLQEGLIAKHIGIIKIDTEGNDLNVLKGMSVIHADILMCEFFMPGIYNGWELGHPQGLIEAAKQLGFNHYIAIKRIDEYEMTSIDNAFFLDKQWGNLIFIKDNIFAAARIELDNLVSNKEIELLTKVVSNTENLRQECKARLDLIEAQEKDIARLRKNQIPRVKSVLKAGNRFLQKTIGRNL